jgi:hypothetical protein
LSVPGDAAPAPPAHEPFLRRLRKAGRDPEPFRSRARTWLGLGAATLAVLAAVPVVAPAWSTLTQRLATLLSLVFLLAAVGLWMGMRARAFAVSSALVLVVYALTLWTRFAFPLQDFFVVAVLVSFAIFALAGFNLVFVLEEAVYDAHVRVHVAGRGWQAVPTAVCVLLTLGLPLWRQHGGPSLPALWLAAVAGALLLLFWWTVAWANSLNETTVLRELHLFVLGALAATALADGVRVAGRLRELPTLVPSLFAYLVLIGTWVYVSYTTLQRTHFLLKGENWRPWVAILLGASFAILAHSQVLVAKSGAKAVADLVDLRVNYLIAGIWIGIAFYAGRGLTRVVRYAQATGVLGRRATSIARGAERVAGGLLVPERVLEGAAQAVFKGFDTVLPGQHDPPKPPPRAEASPGQGVGDLRLSRPSGDFHREGSQDPAKRDSTKRKR